jgi:hypothetical protein
VEFAVRKTPGARVSVSSCGRHSIVEGFSVGERDAYSLSPILLFAGDLKSLFSSVSAAVLVVRGSCPSCVPWGTYARRQIHNSPHTPGSGRPQPLNWPDLRNDDAYNVGVKKRADGAAC